MPVPLLWPDNQFTKPRDFWDSDKKQREYIVSVAAAHNGVYDPSGNFEIPVENDDKDGCESVCHNDHNPCTKKICKKIYNGHYSQLVCQKIRPAYEGEMCPTDDGVGTCKAGVCTP